MHLLTSLDISNNPIENIETLASIPTLETVNLENTNVFDLSALAQLPNLQQINITSTQVFDISPLNAGVYIEMGRFSQALSLEFGQNYKFRDSDFGIYLGSRGVIWESENYDIGLYDNGYIVATSVISDMYDTFLNTTTVLKGTVENSNITLIYNVSVLCPSYVTEWSEKRISLKNCNDYPLIISPMIENCYGFTITFSSEASKGNPYNTKWYIMIKKDDKKWMTVETVSIEEGVAQTLDIVFDEATSFSQVTILPNGNSVPSRCSWNNHITLSNIIFAQE